MSLENFLKITIPLLLIILAAKAVLMTRKKRQNTTRHSPPPIPLASFRFGQPARKFNLRAVLGVGVIICVILLIAGSVVSFFPSLQSSLGLKRGSESKSAAPALAGELVTKVVIAPEAPFVSESVSTKRGAVFKADGPIDVITPQDHKIPLDKDKDFPAMDYARFQSRNGKRVKVYVTVPQ